MNAGSECQPASTCTPGFKVERILDNGCYAVFDVTSQDEGPGGSCTGFEPNFYYDTYTDGDVVVSKLKYNKENKWSISVRIKSNYGVAPGTLNGTISSLVGESGVTVAGCECTSVGCVIYPEFDDSSGQFLLIKVGSKFDTPTLALNPTAGAFSFNLNVSFKPNVGTTCDSAIHEIVTINYDTLTTSIPIGNCKIQSISVLNASGTFVQDCVNFTYSNEAPA